MSDVVLKIVDGPDTGREFPISGALVIGRDPSAGIVLEDAEVSRRHAQVAPRAGLLVIEDLGSTNGTFVNGEQVEGERMLQGGEKVRIGTTVLEVGIPIQATKIASVVPEPAEDPGPGATQVASVMSAEQAHAAAEAEAAPVEPAAEDDERTVVPEPAADGRPATDAPVPAPQAAPPPPPPPPPVVAQQAGPGFQVRSPGAEWALAVLTFGVYPLIWYYRLCKEIGEWSQGRIHTSPGTSLVAVTLGGLVLVPAIVSVVGTMERIRQCQAMAGLGQTASFWGFVGRNLLLGYGYKWLTEQLNELAVRRPVQ